MRALTERFFVTLRVAFFFDEIQACPNAIRSLRYFSEEIPELHLVAAGSLLEFDLVELPSFGVGRLSSLFMYPLSFVEFLWAEGQELLLEALNELHFFCFIFL